ncbi:hypothetical protein PYJP_13760 [Pyrofollis japonicus]|uniref:hypothetical protein n=1 Tax=Pyrofollis japonicus TaxID=3060460 RepID=UPI00295C0C89|nr:hypothetical protein [Pyrofollis japonicus]BEP18024.1 hypothetical protein PYJP_13760 [Pyrofollis japonicus]
MPSTSFLLGLLTFVASITLAVIALWEMLTAGRRGESYEKELRIISRLAMVLGGCLAGFVSAVSLFGIRVPKIVEDAVVASLFAGEAAMILLYYLLRHRHSRLVERRRPAASQRMA